MNVTSIQHSTTVAPGNSDVTQIKTRKIPAPSPVFMPTKERKHIGIRLEGIEKVRPHYFCSKEDRAASIKKYFEQRRKSNPNQ
jgi:hypothetical protein